MRMKIGEKLLQKYEGLCVELDPHFFSVNVGYNCDGMQKRLCTEADWVDYIEKRVEILKLSKFRVMLLPDWYNPSRGIYDFETPEMKSLYKVLELANKFDISVTLTLWGAPKWWYDSYDDSGIWISSPRDVENFAKGFVDCVEELFKRGYTCVKELTPINEPDWAFCRTDGEVEFGKYVELCRLVDSFLKEKKLRKKILLNLSDSTSDRVYWLKKTIKELDDVADKYNIHVYSFSYENLNEDITGWNDFIMDMVNPTKKPIVLGEFGSRLCFGSSHQSDIDIYERGFLFIRLIINFLNTGITSLSYWTLFDQYYGRGGDLMELGLWKYADKKYETRPQYYAYGLVSSKTRKGMVIKPIQSESFFTAGVCLSDEQDETIIVCNHRRVSEDMEIEGLTHEKYKVYIYEEGALPKDDSMIKSFKTVKAVNGKINYIFEPHKAYLLSTM